MGAPTLAASGDTALGLALGLAVCVVLGVLLVRERRRTRTLLRRTEAETDALRARLDELTAMVTARQAPRAPVPAEFVITDAGEPRAEPAPVADRLVLSATLGEPLVKAAALSHGLRRALSARSRNRIWFEVRREVRRARKQRRRDLRDALRQAQADQRAGLAPQDAA